MDREQTNNAGMFSGPVEKDGLTLYPMTMGLRQTLERRGNPFATGGETESAKHLNELLFVFCHSGHDLMQVSDEQWDAEVERFAYGLDAARVKTIENHIASEIKKLESSETTSMPGKQSPTSPQA